MNPMKTSNLGWSGMHVLVGLCLSVIAVGCGGGKATSLGQQGTYVPPEPQGGDPGTTQAQKAIDNAAITAGILDTAGQFERQLLGEAGGVNRSSSRTTAEVSSAATATNVGLSGKAGGTKSSASSPTLRPPNLGAMSGSSGSGSPGGNGSGGLGSASGGGSRGSGAGGAGPEAGSAANPGSAANQGAAATAAAARAGGGGRSGLGGGGPGNSISDLFGSGGSESGGSSRSDAFGAKPGDVNPLGSEDPNDYFTRLGMGDNIFKIVERRYRNKAVTWARNAVDSVTSKSRVP